MKEVFITVRRQPLTKVAPADYTAKALDLIRGCNGVGGALWVAAQSKNDELFNRIKELAVVNDGPVIIGMAMFTREIIIRPDFAKGG